MSPSDLAPLSLSPADMSAVLCDHLARRPQMQLQDVYKLLYQAVRGPEHLIASADDFRMRLAKEWDAVPAESDEPLLEAIRADGRLARANLRPLKARGAALGALAAACLEAAALPWGTASELRQAWATFAGLGLPAFPAEQVQDYTRWLAAHSYPTVHHSERYRELYQPAYRLICPEQPLARRLYA